jgi:hypothetical protein
LKKLFLLAIFAVFVCHAQTAQLGLIVLNTGTGTAARVPPDWQVKVNHGKPDVSVCPSDHGSCLHLKSNKASFALERNVDIDPSEMPYITWKWKVGQLPDRGDFRHASTDDQAAQVLVAFADRRVISYIWDTNAPKGASQMTGFIPLVHVFAVVCESGGGDLNRWLAETRNFAADYQRAYGKPAPRVKALRIQINSQHTGTWAESYFGEVAFRSTPQ